MAGFAGTGAQMLTTDIQISIFAWQSCYIRNRSAQVRGISRLRIFFERTHHYQSTIYNCIMGDGGKTTNSLGKLREYHGVFHILNQGTQLFDKRGKSINPAKRIPKLIAGCHELVESMRQCVEKKLQTVDLSLLCVSQSCVYLSTIGVPLLGQPEPFRFLVHRIGDALELLGGGSTDVGGLNTRDRLGQRYSSNLSCVHGCH